MENHGLPCSKNLGKTNKNRMEIMEIQEMLKFKFMHFLESLCSGEMENVIVEPLESPTRFQTIWRNEKTIQGEWKERMTL